MNSSGSPFLSLFAVIRGLRGAVGGWSVRGLLGVALGVLLYRRLGSICRDMEGLASRFAAGRVRRVVGRVSVRSGDRAARVVAARARDWPGDFGWLVKAAAWEAAGFGSQLRAVLETEEMRALLVACPQAVRVLRPLCRMLAIEGSVLRPGVGVAGAVVAVARPKRVRVVVDLGRVPIPRGVMAAVRRGRYGVV